MSGLGTRKSQEIATKGRGYEKKKSTTGDIKEGDCTKKVRAEMKKREDFICKIVGGGYGT